MADMHDYKFNHLVIVTYCIGSFTSVTGASNHQEGSLEQGVGLVPFFLVNLLINS